MTTYYTGQGCLEIHVCKEIEREREYRWLGALSTLRAGDLVWGGKKDPQFMKARKGKLGLFGVDRNGIDANVLG